MGARPPALAADQDVPTLPRHRPPVPDETAGPGSRARRLVPADSIGEAPPMIEVTPGTVAVYADVLCPWAHLAVHRLHAAREWLGLEDEVILDMRALPLELLNRRPTPKPTLDAELAVVGALDSSAGWHVWDRPSWRYPVTSLPALEAVQAAKEQGLRVAEELDRALRRAFFADCRCVSLLTEVLEVAAGCPSVDVAALADALADGRARWAVMAQHAQSLQGEVLGSPHVFLPSGVGIHNPGIELHWEGETGAGFPVVDADDPSVFRELLQAAGTSAASSAVGGRF